MLALLAKTVAEKLVTAKSVDTHDVLHTVLAQEFHGERSDDQYCLALS